MTFEPCATRDFQPDAIHCLRRVYENEQSRYLSIQHDYRDKLSAVWNREGNSAYYRRLAREEKKALERQAEVIRKAKEAIGNVSKT